jgi:transposase
MIAASAAVQRGIGHRTGAVRASEDGPSLVMLLASSKGNEAPRIAENLGWGQQTVREAIHDFDARGVDALAAKSSRPKRTPAMPSTRKAPRL